MNFEAAAEMADELKAYLETLVNTVALTK